MTEHSLLLLGSLALASTSLMSGRGRPVSFGEKWRALLLALRELWQATPPYIIGEALRTVWGQERIMSLLRRMYARARSCSLSAHSYALGSTAAPATPASPARSRRRRAH